jgi:uncharacterized membrane protein
MSTTHSLASALHEEEIKLLYALRQARRKSKERGDHVTTGQRIADGVASVMGSWPFIIVQSILLLAWMFLNVVGWVRSWDPYPFILLNLALSFQAAYAAPFIMMSQNRQASIDRAEAKGDYDVNRKAELEIELLHEKVDMLRDQQVAELISVLKSLDTRISALMPKS